MPLVAISVNGRRYEVNCGDGEEDRLRQLADGVDQRVRSLATSVGQAGEVRLLLLTCLLLQDELIEARRDPAAIGGDGTPAAAAAAAAGFDPAFAEELGRLAERIEVVAAQLKQP
ncbi:MAG: cell division protein ZapA [Rhodospirillales bacterium]